MLIRNLVVAHSIERLNRVAALADDQTSSIKANDAMWKRLHDYVRTISHQDWPSVVLPVIGLKAKVQFWLILQRKN